jgi:hypothetical protein
LLFLIVTPLSGSQVPATEPTVNMAPDYWTSSDFFDDWLKFRHPVLSSRSSVVGAPTMSVDRGRPEVIGRRLK